MQTFELKFSGVTILQGVEFPVFLLILSWALQQCSATALPVMTSWHQRDCHFLVQHFHLCYLVHHFLVAYFSRPLTIRHAWWAVHVVCLVSRASRRRHTQCGNWTCKSRQPQNHILHKSTELTQHVTHIRCVYSESTVNNVTCPRRQSFSRTSHLTNTYNNTQGLQ